MQNQNSQSKSEYAKPQSQQIKVHLIQKKRKKRKSKKEPLTEEWVARLDGTSQYWQLSEPINLIAGDVVELCFAGGAVQNAYAMFFESDSKNLYISVTAGKTEFRLKAAFGTPMLNGGEIDNNTTPVPLGGSNVISAGAVSGEALSLLGGRVGGSLIMNLPLYNFKVIRNGAVIHEIPLTNKSQGANQMPTVGTVSATMVNYTDGVWENI